IALDSPIADRLGEPLRELRFGEPHRFDDRVALAAGEREDQPNEKHQDATKNHLRALQARSVRVCKLLNLLEFVESFGALRHNGGRQSSRFRRVRAMGSDTRGSGTARSSVGRAAKASSSLTSARSLKTLRSFSLLSL